MRIKWFGLSSFLITTQENINILLDPFRPGVFGLDYGRIDEVADIVLVSHHHGDHDYIEGAKGNPFQIIGAGTFSHKGIQFTGIASYHDAFEGQQRGDNTIYCFTVDGMRICHLGDLGHQISEKQLQQAGKIDVLLVPVGGRATIGPEEAKLLCETVKPGVAIPMHYNTGRTSLPYGLKELRKTWPDARQTGTSVIELSKDRLPETTEIVILEEAL